MSDISTAAIPKDAHLWKRDGLDWYQEPIASTVALLKVEKFVGEIWDPACGAGNIIKACESVGYEATGSDIVCRAPSAAWFYGKHDFLGSYDFSFPKPNIITNPPFYRAKGTEAFIRKARDAFTCQYCGATSKRLECDHVIPVSKGGRTELGNLVTACKPCNRSKGAKAPWEWRQ